MASVDCSALVALFRSTNGVRYWTNKDNWGTDADLSLWHGVKVNQEGQVVELILSGNNLRGKHPLYARLCCLVGILIDRSKWPAWSTARTAVYSRAPVVRTTTRYDARMFFRLRTWSALVATPTMLRASTTLRAFDLHPL